MKKERNGKEILINTNVLIEYLGNLLPKNVAEKVGIIVDEDFNISFINKIEILGHISAFNEVNLFLSTATVFYINDEIIDATISFRKSSKIKLPDAILAATAITYNLVLLTRNTDDFKNIKNLLVENAWDWNTQ